MPREQPGTAFTTSEISAHPGSKLPAFDKACPKPSANQEQEQEQEQELQHQQDHKRKLAAKGAPPADPRHKSVFDSCFEAYTVKYGVDPTWGSRDGSALKRFLTEHAGIRAEEIARRYHHLLRSTDRYHTEKHGAMCHLLSNFDAFADGPILERTNSNGKTGISADQRTRDNLIAAGLLQN